MKMKGLQVLMPVITAFVMMLAVASTAVALRFGFDPALGEPLLARFYSPIDVWRWGAAWGLEPPYRAMFLQGIALAFLPVLGAGFGLIRLAIRRGGLGQRPAHWREAGLGTPAALLRTGRICTKGDGIVLGRAGGRVLRDHGDAHVMVLGPTRSGKDTGHVIPTLLLHTGSALVFDPKGELGRITARRRAAFGDVVTLRPFDPDTQAFNPLLEIRGGRHLVGDCQMAAQMLVPGGPAAHHDRFWDQAAAKLLTAMLIHVCASDRPTLAHLWQLALAFDAGRYPTQSHPQAEEIFAGHAAKDSRVRSSIIETLTTHLAVLNDPALQHATRRSDFQAGDLQAADRPLTVYLSIPPAHGERLRPVTRLLLLSLLYPLLHDEEWTTDGRRKRRPLLALFNEFPQLGYMAFLEHGLAICAGYGIRAMLVAQDEDQIRSTYGSEQSITANCTTHCVIPGFSHSALETYRRWAGETTITHGSRQRQPGKLGLPTIGESETRVPTLDAAEMLRRSRDEVLVYTVGASPTWLEKVRYYRERPFIDLLDRPTLPVMSMQENANVR